MKRTIKDLPPIERPREKLIKYGPEKLSNAELLAIILRSGIKGQNVVNLSKKILNKFAANISEINIEDLKNFPGLGPAKSCQIIALVELGKRLFQNKKSSIYLSPKDIFNDLRDIRSSKKEHFVVFYLDARNQEIKKEIISVGTINSSIVHPREVYEPAVKHMAAQIVIAHNHPTGILEPSKEDIEVTNKLLKAGEVLGIDLTDHIIVSENNYFSFKENKLI